MAKVQRLRKLLCRAKNVEQPLVKYGKLWRESAMLSL